MQSYISKILARLMDARGITQADLSRKTGVGQPTISRILKPHGPKGIKNPTDLQVKPIADFFGISTDELRGHKPLGFELFDLAETGVLREGLAPFNRSAKESAPTNVEAGPEIKGHVPLISWVQAGSWCEVEDIYAVGDAEEWMPCPTTHGPRTYVLRVRGLSMFNPHERRSFRDGDLIFCDPDAQAGNGSMVVVKLDDSQEATFKQLVVEGAERFLKPLNPAWPEPIIKINGNAHICGVVIGKYEPF
ncbi:MAG: helix-turn-helix domain-containing protein [Pseudomonas sp.]|nr:helix-turn-helix domain-containing protein [Pseudomonas sp.]